MKDCSRCCDSPPCEGPSIEVRVKSLYETRRLASSCGFKALDESEQWYSTCTSVLTEIYDHDCEGGGGGCVIDNRSYNFVCTFVESKLWGYDDPENPEADPDCFPHACLGSNEVTGTRTWEAYCDGSGGGSGTCDGFHSSYDDCFFFTNPEDNTATTAEVDLDTGNCSNYEYRINWTLSGLLTDETFEEMLLRAETQLDNCEDWSDWGNGCARRIENETIGSVELAKVQVRFGLHKPTGTCYLKAWLDKVTTVTTYTEVEGETVISETVTYENIDDYEWFGSGDPCFSNDLKAYDHSDNRIVVESPEITIGVPDTNNTEICFRVRYTCVQGYEPDIESANPVNGYPSV